MRCIRPLACFLSIVNITKASSDRRLNHHHSTTDSFRPQSYVARVENYRYVSSPNATEPDEDGQQMLHTLHKSTDITESIEVHGAASERTETLRTTKTRRPWKGFNELDKEIFKAALPLSAIFAIMPVAMSTNLFWVNRLGNTLAVAGQSAANQVFSSFFWLVSFLPSVTATMVSKSYASGDTEATQDAVCQALLFAIVISLAGTTLMFLNPAKFLSSIMKDGAPALQVAVPYLRTRAFSFMPMLVAFVGFSTFRGMMDVTTSVKIALIANMVTIVLDPLLIHVFGVGVHGAAIASVAGDTVNAIMYIQLLINRGLIQWKKLIRLPSWNTLAPLVKGGIALQIRSFALNLTQLMVARVIQSIDDTGVAPAAHALAMQTFMLGSVFLGALGMATQTMVPMAMARGHDTGDGSMAEGVTYAEALVKRLFNWGIGLGFAIGLIELLFLPIILKSSPLPEVRAAARTPALISIAFQWINGVVNVGEGVMMGSGNFEWLSINAAVAVLVYLGALRVFPKMFGLTGVWMSLATFSLMRSAGVWAYLLVRKPLKNHSIED